MPEVKKLWIVNDASEDVLDDPAIQDEEHRLAHFCGALDEGGYSLDKFLRIFEGTGYATWKKENTKVYDDEASARKDAEARLAKLRAKAAKKKPKKVASVATRVAERYGAEKALTERVAKRFSS